MPVARSTPAIRWTLPPRLRPEDVEQWMANLPPTATDVTLHLGQRGCVAAPGGSAALQGALCLLHRQGVTTRLSYPPLTFRDSRGAHLFATSTDSGASIPLEIDTEPHTEAERTLAYRLPGLILAQLCEPEMDSQRLDWIRALQADTVRRSGTIFGSGKDRVLAVIGLGDDRERLRDGPSQRMQRLESLVLKLLGSTKYHPRGGTTAMLQLVEFIYQATENTFDHARRDLDGNYIRQVRFVSIERFQVGSGAAAVPIEELAPDARSPLAQFLRRLETRAQTVGQDPSRMQLLSVTVADGGVGVAARMSNSLDVYSTDADFELKLVQESVLPEGTTKPPGEPGRGAGFKKMMRATYNLDGLFQLRTGRLELHRTYVNEDGSVDKYDFNGRNSPAFDLGGAGVIQPMRAGTSASLIFPNLDLLGRPGSPFKGRR